MAGGKHKEVLEIEVAISLDDQLLVVVEHYAANVGVVCHTDHLSDVA